MDKLTVIAKFWAKEGCEEDLEKALRAVVAPTHQEAGCIRYALNRSIEVPGTFIMVESWESQEALDLHFKKDYIKNLLSSVSELVEEEPEIDALELIPLGDPVKGSI